jgi:hypothetical protein
LLPPTVLDWPADRAARADAWPKVLEFLRHRTADVSGSN